MLLTHSNRINKHKDKKSSGCAMCKPYKHGYAHSFKIKERVSQKEITQSIIRGDENE